MRVHKRTTDGRTVIAREPAVGAHPHPRHAGKLFTITGVNKVLVEGDDGEPVEIHECDQCGWLHADVKSVTSHMTAHSDSDRMQHDPEIIKRLVRECLTVQRDHGHRGYATIVAEKLNAAGITNSRGGAWTPGSVSHIFNDYRDKYRVKVRGGRDRPVSAPPAPPTSSANGAVAQSSSVHLVLDRIEESLRQRVAELAELADVLRAVRAELDKLPSVDAETVADAQRWRQFQLLMGDKK